MTSPGLYVAKGDGFWWSGNTQAGAWSSNAKSGFTLTLDEQFTGGALDTSRWHPYQDSVDGHFGGSTRIQTYMYANNVVGAGTSGATGGTSLKMTVNETDAGSGTLPSVGSAGTRYSYTAGMMTSRDVNVYYPRYGWYEQRCKIPHAQGLWAAPFWLTAKNGGSGTYEVDIVEYFHSQVPGKMSWTMHGLNNTPTYITNKYTNNGSAPNGGGPTRQFFEAPTATPGWHTWACEIVPVTDSGGLTLGDPTQPSANVRFTFYLDGVQCWRIVDTTSLYWTTNGGDEDSFWNIFMQGCQVDGNSIGHPRDAQLGYSHWTDTCLISGSPGSCSTTSGGYSVRRATFDGVANVTEVDYVRIWKYTG
jgi:hypothetical protein